MSFDGRYRTFEIEPRHIVREARVLNGILGQGATADWVYSRARTYVDGLPEALSLAAEEASLSGEERRFAASLVDRARERTGDLRRQLDRRQ